MGAVAVDENASPGEAAPSASALTLETPTPAGQLAPQNNTLWEQAAAQRSLPLEAPRYVVLGGLAGLVLGFVGIGPAWMLAPVLAHTSGTSSSSVAATSD